MVSLKNFEDEIARNSLEIIEKGITSALPNFNNLMFAVVKKCNQLSVCRKDIDK